MINVCFKYLKTFLALEVRKINFSIASIFGIYVNFLDLLFLDEFTIVLLALLLISKILLLSILNLFEVKFDDLIAFNSKISNATILLKP